MRKDQEQRTTGKLGTTVIAIVLIVIAACIWFGRAYGSV